MDQKKYYIQGMHCASCEMLLEKEVKKIAGVQKCEANHKSGELTIKADHPVSFKSLKKAAQRCDLKLLTDKSVQESKIRRNTFEDYLQILLIFIGVFILGIMLKEMEISRFFPDASQNVGVPVALILGIVASLSTCLVLVGGIVLSFGSMVASDSNKTFLQRAHPHIYFHIGRLAAFFVLGGLLGFLGGKINYSLGFTGFLTLLVAIVMIYIGLQTLNMVPSITRLGFHLPKGLSKHVHSLQSCEHKAAPAVIGGLTFLLPCGFTQSMQLAAVASGSFWAGSMIMLAFAMGTLPALFFLGLGSSFMQNKDFGMLKKTIGVVVILFGLYSVQSGLALSGFSFQAALVDSENAIAAEQSGDEQVVRMKVDWVFEPSEFKIKKGVPVRWEVEGVNVSGCTNEIIIPRLGISQRINSGKNVIEFTPKESGVLPFSCWMGMVTGRFVVTE